MSRRVKLPTKERGEVEIVAIWEKKGEWEPEWEPMRATEIADLIPRIPQAMFTDALGGYTRPLALALGLPPEGALVKIPPVNRQCINRAKCPHYLKAFCFPTTKKNLPWCYEAEGIDEGARTAVTQAITFWREGIYLVIVTEDHDRAQQ